MALTVLLLLTAAGCSGNSFTDDGDAIETSNVTSPTTETPSPKTYPPGVSEQGITNVSALAEANRQTLFKTGYVSGFEMTGQMTQQGQTRNMTMAQREIVTSNASKFLFQVQRQTGQQYSRTDIWSNRSTTLLRQERFGRTSYEEMNASSVRPQLGGRQMLETYLRSGEFTVESINQTNQGATYTLVASEYIKPSGTQLPAAENVSNYRGEVVVNSKSQIRHLQITMDYTSPEGGEASLVIRYALLESGSIEHPQPRWLEDALANTTKSSGNGHDHSDHEH